MLVTGIEIKFTEQGYSASEGDGEIVVTVQTSGRRATPVTVRVTPINYDDFLLLEKPLLNGLLDVPPSNDGPVVRQGGIKSHNRANRVLFPCRLLPLR